VEQDLNQIVLEEVVEDPLLQELQVDLDQLLHQVEQEQKIVFQDLQCFTLGEVDQDKVETLHKVVEVDLVEQVVEVEVEMDLIQLLQERQILAVVVEVEQTQLLQDLLDLMLVKQAVQESLL